MAVPALAPTVIDEESLYSINYFNSGSDPNWQRSSSQIVRVGGAVYASGQEQIILAAVSSLTRSGTTVTCVTATPHGKSSTNTVDISGALPVSTPVTANTGYNGTKTITVDDANTFHYTITDSPSSPATGTIIVTEAARHNIRWTLWKRLLSTWTKVYTSTKKEREPAPIACLPDGKIVISGNPCTDQTNPYDVDALTTPLISTFTPDTWTPVETNPTWYYSAGFFDHSYRTMTVDRSTGELFLIQNYELTKGEWAYRDAAGTWSLNGELFWESGYRITYPVTIVRNKAVYILGRTSNNSTGTEVRLVFSYTLDISKYAFSAWYEVRAISPGDDAVQEMDMWLAPNGDLHILWKETPLTYHGDRYLMKYGLIHEGALTVTRIVADYADGDGPMAEYARFHATNDGRLFIIYSASRWSATSIMAIREVLADTTLGTAVTIPITTPMKVFFTSTERGGSPSTDIVDLYGSSFDYVYGYSLTRLYAQVRLFAPTVKTALSFLG
jgi:hypothetical protein